MSTSLPVKCHLPLITTRIEFQFNVLPPPPQITPRRDLGAVIRRQARRATPYGRSNRGDTPIRAESPLTDIPDSDTDSRSDDESRRSSHKISKPKGEAGKSNSGGYNLQDAMGWENEEFSTFTVSQAFHVPKKITKLPSQQKYISNEAEKKLDTKICYSKQNREDLDIFIQSVRIRAMFRFYFSYRKSRRQNDSRYKTGITTIGQFAMH
jgi:hypothetical protein